MKQIMNEPLARLGLVPDMKLSLCQTQCDTFAALVEHNKCHHCFANPVLDLPGDGRLSVAKNPATMHDGKTVRPKRAFPDFGNFQFDLGENAAGRVALAALAQDRALDNKRGFLSQFFDRKRCELNRAQRGGQHTSQEKHRKFSLHPQTIDNRYATGKKYLEATGGMSSVGRASRRDRLGEGAERFAAGHGADQSSFLLRVDDRYIALFA